MSMGNFMKTVIRADIFSAYAIFYLNKNNLKNSLKLFDENYPELKKN